MLLGPGGAMAVVADSFLMKQQLLIINRARQQVMDPRINDHPEICYRINRLLFSGPTGSLPNKNHKPNFTIERWHHNQESTLHETTANVVRLRIADNQSRLIRWV